MRIRRRIGVSVVATLVVGGLVVTTPAAASGEPSGPLQPGVALSPTSTVEGAKSVTGRLAQTDPALLGRTDATPVNVVVKLDYDATASYAGDIAGLAATSPSVTGHELTGTSAAEQAYARYTGGIDSSFRADVAAQRPVGAGRRRACTTVYGGVAVRLPANQVEQAAGAARRRRRAGRHARTAADRLEHRRSSARRRSGTRRAVRRWPARA